MGGYVRTSRPSFSDILHLVFFFFSMFVNGSGVSRSISHQGGYFFPAYQYQFLHFVVFLSGLLVC